MSNNMVKQETHNHLEKSNFCLSVQKRVKILKKGGESDHGQKEEGDTSAAILRSTITCTHFHIPAQKPGMTW